MALRGLCAGALGLAMAVGGCRSEPARPSPARAVAPGPTATSAAEQRVPPRRLIAELLDPSNGPAGGTPAAVIELELPGTPGGPDDTGQAAWAASGPARRDGRGVVRSESGVAATLWDGKRLVVDLDQTIPDLGVRLVLTRDAAGAWSGTWQRITIAGPVEGGPVRAFVVEPAGEGAGQ